MTHYEPHPTADVSPRATIGEDARIWHQAQVREGAVIGKGVIDPSIIDVNVILAALIGAISWNLITWYYGIPSSSSHALIGGLGGAAVAKVGVHGLVASGFIKIGISIVASRRRSRR